MYTSTLTCGVDFNRSHYDTLVCQFQYKTGDCLGFMQGLLRVRKFNLNTHYCYMPPKQYNFIN